MAIAMDQAGRLVIPKPVRDAAGLKPGIPLEILVVDGAVVIRPTTKKGGSEFLGHIEEFRREHKIRLSKQEVLDLCEGALEEL